MLFATPGTCPIIAGPHTCAKLSQGEHLVMVLCRAAHLQQLAFTHLPRPHFSHQDNLNIRPSRACGLQCRGEPAFFLLSINPSLQPPRDHSPARASPQTFLTPACTDPCCACPKCNRRPVRLLQTLSNCTPPRPPGATCFTWAPSQAPEWAPPMSSTCRPRLHPHRPQTEP